MPVALTAPLHPEVPGLPSEAFWTPTQWAVFMAIMDTVIPAIVPKSALTDKRAQRGIPDLEYAALIKADMVLESGDKDVLVAFLEDKPSTNPVFRGMLLRTLYRLPPKLRDGLGLFLSVLSCVPTAVYCLHLASSCAQLFSCNHSTF